MAHYIEPNGRKCLENMDPPRSVDTEATSLEDSHSRAQENSISALICDKLGLCKEKFSSALVVMKSWIRKEKKN
ncbi:hypothetical protein X943_001458 [Babesia divergens]|uniref:Uncharacterized protein n=1 Tax=Babesia divergens TaxID=32595 RepID=A0AAD9GHA4_BABDI|nr:hypothetical protein X943_001458 [Babesia divergens]